MSFWGEPAVQAGPYGRPARPGIFDRVLAGLNVAMNVGDFYQNWKSKASAQEQNKMSAFANKLGIQKALAGEGPVSMEKLGPEAEALGLQPTRVTPESQVEQAGGIFQRAAGMPVQESRRGLTTPTDQGVAARGAAAAQGIANIPAVGGYAPLQPAFSVDREKAKIIQATPPEKREELLFPRTMQNPIYDDEGNVIGYSAGKPFQMKPSQESKTADWKERQGILQQNRKEMKATPGATSGRGGSGTMTAAKQKEEAYQDWKSKQAIGTDNSRMAFNQVWQKSVQKPFTSTRTITEPRGAGQIVTKVPFEPNGTSDQKPQLSGRELANTLRSMKEGEMKTIDGVNYKMEKGVVHRQVGNTPEEDQQ